MNFQGFLEEFTPRPWQLSSEDNNITPEMLFLGRDDHSLEVAFATAKSKPSEQVEGFGNIVKAIARAIFPG